MRQKVLGRAVLLTFVFIAGTGGTAPAQNVQPSHADKIGAYEGPQTCRGCHPEAFKAVAESLHYQQMAEPQFLVDWPKGQLAGQAWSF